MPRPGHEGKLTHQACLAYQDGPSGPICSQWHIIDYPLADPTVQAELDRFNFTCRIAGRRYKVCHNEKDKDGKPLVGFCRFKYTTNCVLGICGAKTRHVDYLSITPYQVILDSGVRCSNTELYPIESGVSYE